MFHLQLLALVLLQALVVRDLLNETSNILLEDFSDHLAWDLLALDGVEQECREVGSFRPVASTTNVAICQRAGASAAFAAAGSYVASLHRTERIAQTPPRYRPDY
ncbi:hypothetical protein [Microvirga massiliensis]|uniref:hypothetical protein n=1 Tax=Microvirga massiliensis TaxID=1033741 RepID=UPI00062BEA9C|nr:hypothetical protein [Microvirga massiliensis]